MAGLVLAATFIPLFSHGNTPWKPCYENACNLIWWICSTFTSFMRLRSTHNIGAYCLLFVLHEFAARSPLDVARPTPIATS